MEINHNNVKDLAGNIVDRLLIGIETGALPVTGKGRRIMWEEYVINELKYSIDRGIYPSTVTEIEHIP